MAGQTPTFGQQWGGTIGASVSTIGNIISTYMNNKANSEEALKDRQFQELMAQRANDWSIQQWNRENAYNDPSAQMERLRRAGLNPNLVFSNGSLNNSAAPSPSVQMPSGSSAAGSQHPFLIDPLTAAQIANINADTRLKEDQGNLFNSQVKVNENSIEVSNVRLNIDKNLSDSQIGYLAKQCENIERNWKLLDERVQEVRANIRNLDAKTAGQELENLFNDKTMQTRIDQEVARLNAMYQDYQMTASEYQHLLKMYIIDEQMANEELNQFIATGKFNASIRPYQILEQQYNAWSAGTGFRTAEFNLFQAQDKRERWGVVGRYIDDVLGSAGQVFGGTASHSVSVQGRSSHTPVSGFSPGFSSKSFKGFKVKPFRF